MVTYTQRRPVEPWVEAQLREIALAVEWSFLYGPREPEAGPWRADECVALGHVEFHDGLCARCRGPLGDVE